MAEFHHQGRSADLQQGVDASVEQEGINSDVGDVASKTRFTSNGAIPTVDTGSYGLRGISPSDRAYGNSLDLGTGFQSHNSTKSAGPIQGAPPEKLSEADQLVDTNIRAAQNEVEELLAIAADEKVDVKKLDSKLARATLYLDEALGTMGESNAKSSTIESALASLLAYETKLQNLFHIRAISNGPNAAAYATLREEPMRHFLHSEGQLMRRYGIPAKAAADPTIGKGKDGGAPEVTAIEASLHLAEVHAKEGFDQLANQTGDVKQRDAIVKATAAKIYGHLNHAMVMGALLDPKQKEAIKPAIEAVSTNVLLMKRWMDNRTGNKGMITAFAGVLATLNGVRADVGLDAVDQEAVKGFPEHEEAEETLEKGAMTAAVNKCTAAWTALEGAMQTGIDDWFDLAQVAKEKKPSFVATLLEGLVDGVAGLIGGELSKRLLEVAAEEVREQLIEISTEVMKAKLKEIATAGLEAGKKEGGAEKDLKALHAVRGSMRSLCSGFHTEHVKKLNDQVAAGELSIAQVGDLEAAANAAKEQATADLKFRSATEWAKYMARAGVRDDATGNSGVTKDGATDMGGYYGTYHPAEPREPAYRANNHEGTAGVLGVQVKNYEPGLTGQSDVLTNLSLDLNGMNDELRDLLFSDESVKTLGDVKVPMEVSVEYKVALQRGTVAHPKLRFAVDEKGRVRDRMTVKDHDEEPPGDISIWDKIRQLPVPKSEAK